MSRLAEIYKSEKSKDGGLLSTFGKRLAEKYDPRQLVDQQGLLATMMPFLKTYSATSGKSKGISSGLKSSSMSPENIISANLGSSELITIQKNTEISAKNSMVLPSMARDMNVMRQNIVKMVKLSGGTPSTKADAFFLKSKERESLYESKFGKKESTSPTKTGETESKKEGGSFFGDLLKGLAIAGIVAAMVKGISEYFSNEEFRNSVNRILENIFTPIKDLMSEHWGKLAIGIAAAFPLQTISALSFAFKTLIPLLTGPVGLIAALGLATKLMLDKFRENHAENKEEKKKLEAVERRGGQLTDTEYSNLQRLKQMYGPGSATETRLALEENDRRIARDARAARKAAAAGLTGGQNGAMSTEPSFGLGLTSTTPTKTDGASLLNQVLDEEGVTDPTVRSHIFGLAQKESSLNPSAKGPVITDSNSMHKGDQAQGLLQIMPKTAPEVGYSAEQIKSDPKAAAKAGVRYFLKNLKKFNGDLNKATEAHLTGPGGVGKNRTDSGTGLKASDYVSQVSNFASQFATGKSSMSGENLNSVQAAVSAAATVPQSPTVINNNTRGGDTYNNSSGGNAPRASVTDPDLYNLLLT